MLTHPAIRSETLQRQRAECVSAKPSPHRYTLIVIVILGGILVGGTAQKACATPPGNLLQYVIDQETHAGLDEMREKLVTGIDARISALSESNDRTSALGREEAFGSLTEAATEWAIAEGRVIYLEKRADAKFETDAWRKLEKTLDVARKYRAMREVNDPEKAPEQRGSAGQQSAKWMDSSLLMLEDRIAMLGRVADRRDLLEAMFAKHGRVGSYASVAELLEAKIEFHRYYYRRPRVADAPVAPQSSRPVVPLELEAAARKAAIQYLEVLKNGDPAEALQAFKDPEKGKQLAEGMREIDVIDFDLSGAKWEFDLTGPNTMTLQITGFRMQTVRQGESLDAIRSMRFELSIENDQTRVIHVGSRR